MLNNQRKFLLILGILSFGFLFVAIIPEFYIYNGFVRCRCDLGAVIFFVYIGLSPLVLSFHLSPARQVDSKHTRLQISIRFVAGLARLIYLLTSGIILFVLFALFLVSANHALFILKPFDFLTALIICLTALLTLSISIYFVYTSWRYRNVLRRRQLE